MFGFGLMLLAIGVAATIPSNAGGSGGSIESAASGGGGSGGGGPADTDALLGKASAQSGAATPVPGEAMPLAGDGAVPATHDLLPGHGSGASMRLRDLESGSGAAGGSDGAAGKSTERSRLLS